MDMDDIKLFAQNENPCTGSENIQSGYWNRISFRNMCHANNEKREIIIEGRDRTTNVKYSLADNMRQGKKESHCAVKKWCTGREWPVKCITVISARWRSHMPFQRWRKWHIPMASNRKKSRRWAWLTIWDKVKVPPCRYKVMHRKGVTSELHDNYFRSMTITHAILKTAEVTYPDSQISEEIAGAWRRVHISVWEFEGNIRPTNWTEECEKIPLFTKAGPIVALCALSRPSSTYIEEFKPHGRTILIPLLTAPTSHKRPSTK